MWQSCWLALHTKPFTCCSLSCSSGSCCQKRKLLLQNCCINTSFALEQQQEQHMSVCVCVCPGCVPVPLPDCLCVFVCLVCYTIICVNIYSARFSFNIKREPCQKPPKYLTKQKYSRIFLLHLTPTLSLSLFLLGAIFEQGTDDVQSAFKYAMLNHNLNVSARRFELQAYVDVINTADAFKLSRLSRCCQHTAKHTSTSFTLSPSLPS